MDQNVNGPVNDLGKFPNVRTPARQESLFTILMRFPLMVRSASAADMRRGSHWPKLAKVMSLPDARVIAAGSRDNQRRTRYDSSGKRFVPSAESRCVFQP